MLQTDIVVWLSEVGEARASSWFNDTWTGERGQSMCHGLAFRISPEEFAPWFRIYQSEEKKTPTRFYAQSEPITFRLKQLTSYPRFGKRFRVRNSKLFVSPYRTVKLHTSTMHIKYGKKIWPFPFIKRQGILSLGEYHVSRFRHDNEASLYRNWRHFDAHKIVLLASQQTETGKLLGGARLSMHVSSKWYLRCRTW
jgi:hypothetical protein